MPSPAELKPETFPANILMWNTFTAVTRAYCFVQEEKNNNKMG